MLNEARKPQRKTTRRKRRKSTSVEVEDRASKPKQIKVANRLAKSFFGEKRKTVGLRPQTTKNESVFAAVDKPDQYMLASWNRRKMYKYFDEAVKMAKEFAPDAKSFLDVGCGPTKFLSKLPALFDRQLTLCATDVRANTNLYHETDVRFVSGTGDLRKFADNSYDVVFALHLIENDRFDVSELFRVAKKLVVVVYAYDWSNGPSESLNKTIEWLEAKIPYECFRHNVIADGKQRAVVAYKAPFVENQV